MRSPSGHPWRCGRQTLLWLTLFLLVALPSEARPWLGYSTESGAEIDAPLPKLPNYGPPQRWRSDPKGYTDDRIKRYWNQYKRPKHYDSFDPEDRPKEYFDAN